MPLYIKDYLADTRRLSTLEHGAYLLLIMEYWQHGKLPTGDDDLAFIVGLPLKRWLAIKPRIASLFKDGWRHKRIDEEIAKSEELSSKRKASANYRWSKVDANAEQSDMQNDAHAGVPQSQSQTQKKESSLRSLELVAAEPNGTLFPIDGEIDMRTAKRAKGMSDQVILDRITDQWNRWAVPHGCPKVRYLTGQRAVAARRRLADLSPNGTETPEEAFGVLLSKCEESFFVKGSPRRPLQFDQLMREGFMVKMMEDGFRHIEPEHEERQWRR